jgi:hypothetical protein
MRSMADLCYFNTNARATIPYGKAAYHLSTHEQDPSEIPEGLAELPQARCEPLDSPPSLPSHQMRQVGRTGFVAETLAECLANLRLRSAAWMVRPSPAMKTSASPSIILAVEFRPMSPQSHPAQASIEPWIGTEVTWAILA